MAVHAVEFADVSFTLPGGRQLLRDVSLAVAPGSTTALLGRSGSGKTTLLRTVNALVRPTAGTVRVRGEDVLNADPVRLRRSIGYVIQEAGLFPHMNVARNIGMPLELAGSSPEQIAEKSKAMLDLVGLPADFGERFPWQLSGGQRQRVGVARALAGGADILLMDEPFGALDPLTRAEMQDMLRSLVRRLGVTTLLVTHDLPEAEFLADRVVLVEDGRVAADVPADEVRVSTVPAMQRYVAATVRSAAA